jgi:hypothetical protein
MILPRRTATQLRPNAAAPITLPQNWRPDVKKQAGVPRIRRHWSQKGISTGSAVDRKPLRRLSRVIRFASAGQLRQNQPFRM